MSQAPSADDRQDFSDLFDELEDLDEHVDDEAAREQLREVKEMASDIQRGGTFGKIIYGFDRNDAAEAFLGSLLFGIPMAVEGGTNEAGLFIAEHPLNLVASLLGTLGIVYGLLYVARFQDVRVANAIFGIIPRRFASVITISLVTAVALLTAWGRVDWADPVVAASTVSVALVPMAIGAALGDIIPGT